MMETKARMRAAVFGICVTHEQSIADQTDKIIRLTDGVISSITETGLATR